MGSALDNKSGFPDLKVLSLWLIIGTLHYIFGYWFFRACGLVCFLWVHSARAVYGCWWLCRRLAMSHCWQGPTWAVCGWRRMYLWLFLPSCHVLPVTAAWFVGCLQVWRCRGDHGSGDVHHAQATWRCVCGVISSSVYGASAGRLAWHLWQWLSHHHRWSPTSRLN
jgi:hypothetical protein